MQKWWIIPLLFILSSCRSDIRYSTSDAVVNRKDTTFSAHIEVDILEKKFTSPLGVLIHGFGAFAVYWDGIKLGQNGVPGSAKQAEVPGTETSHYQVPDTLSELGKHQVVVKGSQKYLLEAERTLSARPDNYLTLLRQPLFELSFVNLMAGAFLIAAIYYAFLYYNSKLKQHTTLLFAVICFLFFTLLAAEYLKFYIDIPYTQFYTRLGMVGWLTMALATLVPLYFAIHFNTPYRRYFIGLLVATLLCIYVLEYGHYDFRALLYGLVLWTASVLVLLYARFKKKQGSLLVLLGFATSIVINLYLFFDFGLYVSFTIILLCILYLQTLGAKQLEEAHHAEQLLSSRLQLELIKKNIQPHFLRNTLTSLIDWVEESPAQGVAFIQELSKEFDVMIEIAEKTLIPIRQEILLCQHHLAVMQFRKEIDYIWEDSGIGENELIPPAVIHTLLENGITHSIANDGGGIRFRLSFSKTEAHKEYVFEVFAENRIKTERGGGNGFRYIEARLKESYGDNWTLTSAPFAEGWQTIISIGL